MSDSPAAGGGQTRPPGLVDRVIRFCLTNPLVVALVTIAVIVAGLVVAPFDWQLSRLPRSPVPVDAIPDIGENQQIVFTEWMGRSPQDVEDQITYPLTVSLLGVPGVKTVRSNSMFGFSTIYVIFGEGIDFYWSRSRVLEKLNSLPSGALPEGVQPALGPDATALGQVFWYTLEGRGPDGEPAGGWDLDELRSIQDWYVRYTLLAAEGVSEVASVGGFVREYQVDVDPDAMRAQGVTLQDVSRAVKGANLDVGAGTIEMNRVEYVTRGLGFIKGIEDLTKTVVKATDNVPVYVENVARVSLGPALRRGALDKNGAEAVGGVVVVRYGFNPLAAIKNVKQQIDEIAPGLPAKPVIDFAVTTTADVRAFAEANGFEAYDGAVLNRSAWLGWLDATPRGEWPAWITRSKVTIVPFYDRTGLIYETLGTLNEALRLEVIVTIIVVIVMVMNLGSSLLISGLLPLAVLLCFIAMRVFGVDANIVALSGIAIAIGTIVDMGIIVTENILKHLAAAAPDENRLEVIFRAASEVGGAVVTAVSTTVIGFLPVFTMTGAEGKLFRPLAFTKTFALLASVIVALTIIPAAAHLLLGRARRRAPRFRKVGALALLAAGIAAWIFVDWRLGVVALLLGAYRLLRSAVGDRWARLLPYAVSCAAVVFVAVVLARDWLPLGPEKGLARNLVFVAGLIGGLLLIFYLFIKVYGPALRWCLEHKALFMCVPFLLVLLGAVIWLGFEGIFGFLPDAARNTQGWVGLSSAFPGLGKEFMPPLDEGSFLLMPSTMPHASIGEAMDVLRKQDMAVTAIPEVESSVGKIGRAETPLDPAPISMVETVINYKSEYLTDKAGHRVNFRYDEAAGEFVRDEQGELIPDEDGRSYRQWREHIRSPDDIWDEIESTAQIPGTTRAPKLQPIAARLVMLQSGTRAPMAVKIKGGDLATIEQVGIEIERLLKEVPGVQADAVNADRIVGKPYLEIEIDREAIARYGLSIQSVQNVIQAAIGGKRVTTTVEGRERYGIRIRYMRELRDTIEDLGRVLVASMGGVQVPLEQVVKIHYVRGPMSIKSEDTFLTGYVLFDRRPGYAEVDVIEACRAHLDGKRVSGELGLPPGVSYAFTGTWENQVRAQKTLSVVLPAALFVIFMILYFQFRSTATTAIVFSGILVAWAGGFLLIWLYGQPWFLDFSIFGADMRGLFQVHPINLSVAIWVGFLALFGIASDNGVVIATYLDQAFASRGPATVAEVREATVAAALRRIRPCLMTSATTILALIPVLTSTGRGSDIMVPMAIPSFGGMLVVLVSVFVVPVLYAAVKEHGLRRKA
ncbi:MAG: efflux RND transporter permease subunit [Planctomycetota bacterium]|jgi:Cu(I)/Ag(I) efflux system membrane protein CusA/SilA